MYSEVIKQQWPEMVCVSFKELSFVRVFVCLNRSFVLVFFSKDQGFFFFV